MTLIQLYEELKTKNLELSEVINKKKNMIYKIKSLGEKSTETVEDETTETVEDETTETVEDEASGIEVAIEELNAAEENLKASIEKLEDAIKEKETNAEDVVNSEENTKNQVEKIEKGYINTMDKYLTSKEAIKDLATIVMTKGSAVEAKKAWAAHLTTKGIDTSAFKPEPAVTGVKSVFEGDGNLYALLHQTGLAKYIGAIDSDETVSGKGHKAGTQKKNSDVTLSKIAIVTQGIYKYLTIDREMLVKADNEAIVKYALDILPKRVIEAIERAVIIGDGLGSSANDKISSFKDVATDALTKQVVVTKVDDILDIMDVEIAALANKSKLAVVMSGKTLGKVRTVKDADARRIIPIGAGLDSLFNVKVFTPAWMTDDQVVIFDADQYYVVKDTEGMDMFNDFSLEYNRGEFLAEVYQGGALVAPKSAVNIKVKSA